MSELKLALFLLVASCVSEPPVSPPVYERLPVPKLLFTPVIGSAGEVRPECTGIPIGHGLALTVKHYTGPKYAEHPTLDIALVEIGDIPNILPEGSVRLSDPRLGERLFCIGYPLGGPLAITEGFASAKPGRASFPIAPGNSGSPVFDAQGRFVGVACSVDAIYGPFGGSQLVWHMAYYVPASKFWGWVEEMLVSRRLGACPATSGSSRISATA